MIQGIMMTRKNSFPKKEVMNKLIAHEASRVFRDRLIDDSDQHILDELLLKILKTELNIGSEEQKLIFSDVGVIFCNFNKPDNLYNTPDSIDIVKTKCQFYLKEYNNSANDKMNLVFFSDATKHICRIARCLKQARGNCLLVGISGSGRQSLTKFATKILDYRLKPVVITRNFKMDD
jgi:dynein heavy chain